MVVVAIDPGRSKAGLAVVSSDGVTLHREVAPAEAAVQRVRELWDRFGASVAVLGDRTGSQAFARQLIAIEGVARSGGPVLVDEHRSSEEGRRLWLRDHPARGWRRLLPAGLRTPDGPYDDYVAEVLARRFLESERLRQQQAPGRERLREPPLEPQPTNGNGKERG